MKVFIVATRYWAIKNGVWLIDDYAHNPVKCAAAIEACQPIAPKVIAWFQPHGYGPTKFLRNDFVHEMGKVLRPQDEIWMSEIFYAGGTATKDISANDLINDLKAKTSNAYFVEDRKECLLRYVRSHFTEDCVVAADGCKRSFTGTICKTTFGKICNNLGKLSRHCTVLCLHR